MTVIPMMKCDKRKLVERSINPLGLSFRLLTKIMVKAEAPRKRENTINALCTYYTNSGRENIKILFKPVVYTIVACDPIACMSIMCTV